MFPSPLIFTVSQSVKLRLAVGNCISSSPFFANNPFVQAMLFLDNLALKTPGEKDAFFQQLLDLLPKLPKVSENQSIK